MKLLGNNDERTVRGGEATAPRTAEGDASAAVGYVFQRPSPGALATGTGGLGGVGGIPPAGVGVGGIGVGHDVAAAAEYVAQFAQKQQTRWACGDEHSLDVSITLGLF